MVLAKKTYWRCAFRPPQTELDVGLWISRPHQCHGCHLQREGGQADEERQHWHGKGGTRGRRTERKPKRNERPLPFQSLRWTLIERHSLLFNVDAQVEILVPTHTQALPTCQRSSEYITSHRNSAPRSAVAFQHLRQLKGTTLVDKTPTVWLPPNDPRIRNEFSPFIYARLFTFERSHMCLTGAIIRGVARLTPPSGHKR